MVLKEYIKTDWENTPSTNTPLSKRNLNHLEQGVYDNREALIDVADQVANIDVQTIKESTSQALEYEKSAGQSAENAQTSAQAAQNEAGRAETAAQSVEDMAREAESYARGGTGTRVGEDTDNARAYAELAARIVAASTTGSLIPMGTIPFAQLPTEVVKPGWMYNISDDFESDERFDIPSVHYPKGSNVYYTANKKWDVLAGISPTVESLGAVKKTGDTMTGALKVRMGEIEGGIQSGSVEVGDRVIITSNNEGGNICIVAPDGTKYEFDAYNGNLRLISVRIGPPQTVITPFGIEKTTGITSFIGVKLSGQNENRVPYLNASKQLVSSAITPKELDYLGGVKGKIQQQIDDITEDLGGVSFGITADGRPGYKKDGADTVYPFRETWKEYVGFAEYTEINIGRKPRYVLIQYYLSEQHLGIWLYDESLSSTTAYNMRYNTSKKTSKCSTYSVTSSTSKFVLTDKGFKIKADTAEVNGYYTFVLVE